MRERILVIEDDADIARIVRAYLEHDAFSVKVCSNGVEGLAEALDHPPDLVVLDWMLPGLDGIELLERLRNELETPVIMLTARGEHQDRVRGLRSGADDFVPKPFHPPELVARVNAVLRRSRTESDEQTVQVGELTIEVQKQRVEVSGQRVPLTALEFDLLRELASCPGRVFRRNELLDRVWGRDFAGVDRVVDVHVSKLRQKLEAAGEVVLSAVGERADIRFEVKDSGEGVPADDLPHLFTRFYRVDKSRSHKPRQGSGIGLTIAKHYVERQGGRIGASSGPGVGSSFWFTLPASGAEL